MGEDGARGLLAIHRNGGRTLAQDEASCAVFGMPRAAQRLGAVDRPAALRPDRPRDPATRPRGTTHDRATCRLRRSASAWANCSSNASASDPTPPCAAASSAVSATTPPSRGQDLDGYLDTLLLDDDALQGLLDRITVQETSFFRHPGQFDVLARDLLPRLVPPGHHLERRLRQRPRGIQPGDAARRARHRRVGRRHRRLHDRRAAHRARPLQPARNRRVVPRAHRPAPDRQVPTSGRSTPPSATE